MKERIHKIVTDIIVGSICFALLVCFLLLAPIVLVAEKLGVIDG